MVVSIVARVTLDQSFVWILFVGVDQEYDLVKVQSLSFEFLNLICSFRVADHYEPSDKWF